MKIAGSKLATLIRDSLSPHGNILSTAFCIGTVEGHQVHVTVTRDPADQMPDTEENRCISCGFAIARPAGAGKGRTALGTLRRKRR